MFVARRTIGYGHKGGVARSIVVKWETMNFYEWFFLEKDRPAAGLFSWSHLLSVTVVLVGLIVWAYFLGKKYRDNPKGQRIVLGVASIAIWALYIMKMGFLLATTSDIGNTFLENIPLFFCDAIIFVVPIAALARGRAQNICLDFIAICGFLMGFMGNYFAGNIYSFHPAFSYLSLISAFSHGIAAFAAMFVFKARLNKMEKRDIPFVIGILFVLMTIALVVDYATGKNYMFLLGGDGTPFELVFNWVQHNLIGYQVIIYVMQCGYIGLFYAIYYPIAKRIQSKKKKEEAHAD